MAARAGEKLGLTSQFAHLDATSFSFHGDYDSEDGPAEGAIRIQQGYSRDHRPDLNQAVLDMIVERKAGLPVLMKPLSGNVNDSGSFPELIDRHVEHLQNVHGFDYVVADSALYSKEHVRKLTEGGVKFVTRVPKTISEAKTRIQEAEIESMEPLNAVSISLLWNRLGSLAFVVCMHAFDHVLRCQLPVRLADGAFAVEPLWLDRI